MKEEKPPNSRRSWDDLVFAAIEKIAAAPGKLKDPKESVTAAVDWVKSVRDDVQQKVIADVSQRLKELDWEAISKKVGEHLADRYDIEISAKISLKPKVESSPKVELTEDNEKETKRAPASATSASNVGKNSKSSDDSESQKDFENDL